jgi:hypothetical protein
MQKSANGECSEPDSARDLLPRKSSQPSALPASFQVGGRISLFGSDRR